MGSAATPAQREARAPIATRRNRPQLQLSESDPRAEPGQPPPYELGQAPPPYATSWVAIYDDGGPTPTVFMVAGVEVERVAREYRGRGFELVEGNVGQMPCMLPVPVSPPPEYAGGRE